MPPPKDVQAQLAYWRDALTESEHLCEMMAMPSPPLSEAAKFFGLDLNNQTERNALLGILAFIVFNKPKKGRPREHKGKWDVLTLIQLAVDCNNVKAAMPGIKTGRRRPKLRSATRADTSTTARK
jgi:hypothetical protein